MNRRGGWGASFFFLLVTALWAVLAPAAGTASGGTTTDALYYTLTKNGLQVGMGVAGTKIWKDKELN